MMFTTKKEKAALDYLVYFASILGPIMTIPQAWTIWSRQSAENVSLITWLTYAFLSLIWLAYGIFHKEKPLIILNLLLVAVNSIIVVGIIIYG